MAIGLGVVGQHTPWILRAYECDAVGIERDLAAVEASSAAGAAQLRQTEDLHDTVATFRGAVRADAALSAADA
ncbi:hypothetical protein [Streptomyces sp. NPDC059165]|uniref:hypothetical protein n=1 Tax=Streptomyces sp. NPDC059165 TaxID=3346751 RepID=UPI0036CADE0A